jgi:hypothetical protein
MVLKWNKFRQKKTEIKEETRSTDVQADVDAWLESVIAKGEAKPKSVEAIPKAGVTTSKRAQKVTKKPCRFCSRFFFCNDGEYQICSSDTP